MFLRQFFANVEEAEWAVEVMKSTGKPTAVTLCIGPDGDSCDVPPGECAIRLARAGTGSHLERSTKEVGVVCYPCSTFPPAQQ